MKTASLLSLVLLLGSTAIGQSDFGVLAIWSPPDTVRFNSETIPQVRIYADEDNTEEEVSILVRIGTEYEETIEDTTVEAGDTITLSFLPWDADTTGSFVVLCSLYAGDDVLFDNDTLTAEVHVLPPWLDFSVDALLGLPDTTPYGEDLELRAVVSASDSNDLEPDTLLVRLRVDTTFYDTQEVLVAPGEEDTVEFEDWHARPLGSRTVVCELLVEDSVSGNNALVATTFVYLPAGWTELEEMEETEGVHSTKKVKQDGWLCWDPVDEQVFGTKGNRTSEFYSYDVEGDVWDDFSEIPLGTENKLPKGGAAGTCSPSDECLYVTKGSNTRGFWRYDIAGDTWEQMENVPLGGNYGKVAYGSDVAHAVRNDTGFVYLLKGKTFEFHCFNATTNAWRPRRPDAPAGPSGEEYKPGSFLVYDGNHTIYCHKSKVNELFAYDVNGDTWWSQHLDGMPFYNSVTGKYKKSSEGGCGTWYDGHLYALKGNNTGELWRYSPPTETTPAGTWTALDTIPRVGSTGKKKWIKGGADIVSNGDGVFYALKGNNCLEFWCYVPTAETPGFGSYARNSPWRGTDGAETGLAEGMSALTPRWNGDGSAVVYVREADDGVGAGFDQVYMVRASEPGTEVRLVDCALECSEPVFDPQGCHVCLVVDDTLTERLQLAVVEVPGADVPHWGVTRNIPAQPRQSDRATAQSAAGFGSLVCLPAAAPTGNAVSSAEQLQSPASAPVTMPAVLSPFGLSLAGSTLDGNGSPPVPLNLDFLTNDEWDHFSPDYSPSGNYICYAKDDSTSRTQVYIISSQGGAEQALTDYDDADCESPRFLEDAYISFLFSPDTGYDQVAKLEVNSQDLAVLSHSGRDAETPDPACDGHSVCFAAQGDDDIYQVGVVEANGDNERLVTNSSRDLEEPDWSADGKSIAAVRWFGLTSQIGMVDTASGDFTSLTDSGCIRDKPDVYYVPTTGTNNVVYEREDPNGSDGNKPKPKPRPGTGIFLVRHKKHQDGVMGSGLATDLRRASPNPASGPVTVYWQVAQAGAHATVKAYDAAGRQVNVLFSGKVKAGLNEAVWTCRDSKGRSVPTGVYFCTLETADDRISRKVILTEND